MLENLSSKVTTISANTQVVFSMKNFSALIGGILALFFGFYQLVVVPKIQGIEEQLKTQTLQNQAFQKELAGINTAISLLTMSVNKLLLEKDIKYQLDMPTSGQFNTSFQENYDTLRIDNLLVHNPNRSILFINYSVP